ncbi:MAG: Gfo/Idh/MocA family oxidoreductase [Armatimonadetes bacterium]|nr:Gfo/Idh/MocA family oxidoreductase [Armatimonadota bacterium]
MITRRDFMKKTAATTAVLAAPGAFAVTQDSPSLKVGLIGCGGRGTGAAMDSFHAAQGVVLWAMGDVFEDHLKGSADNLKKELKDSFKVTADRSFVGFDAYQKVIASGVDVVILTTPPAFRPVHLAAAVDAGKHVFMEKPVAVDPSGIRSVIESAKKADTKGLNIVAGTQRRHDVAYRECMQKIHDGALGEVVAAYAYWNQGGLWMNPRQEKWSDMEWQLRNWLYFTWLSGDHICEQHIHNMDVINWAMKGHPVKANCLAGRQVRTDPAYGHIFDHFATEYEYANGMKMVSMCRQIDGTASRVAEHIVGTKGSSNANTSIKGENSWRFEGDRPNPYVVEHTHLIEAIRSGKRINEGVQVAESTMTAILGRIAGYTGQEVTWDDAMKLDMNLMPEKLEFGHLGVPPVAMPGQTKLA